MNRKIIKTDDGSSTIGIPSLDVTYHSRHGAIRESMHVYIDAGLKHFIRENQATDAIDVFEMGLGTGLNALLTLMEAERLQQKISYTAIELHPLEKDIISELNYCDLLPQPGLHKTFLRLHSCEWEIENNISPFFSIKKIYTSLFNFSTDRSFDIIYYDAFAPSAQPELWTEDIFKKIFQMLLPSGVLVTYCSKGEVQRAMKAAGFQLEKLTGPPGKREMVRGKKKIEQRKRNKE
jgi:tRNA U34 5-methylaminomethyl-2-thiouridine-forming methyltransferase MnmC